MKAFAELYLRLDGTTSSNAKLLALREYFSQAPAQDAAWAVYFLAGGRPRQLVPTRLLRELAIELSGLPDWLFEESSQWATWPKPFRYCSPTAPMPVIRVWLSGSSSICCHCAASPRKRYARACQCCGRNLTGRA